MRSKAQAPPFCRPKTASTAAAYSHRTHAHNPPSPIPGIPCLPFHADLANTVKMQTQQQFARGQIKVRKSGAGLFACSWGGGGSCLPSFFFSLHIHVLTRHHHHHQVVAATVAFGMGIDAADVRVVAHWTVGTHEIETKCTYNPRVPSSSNTPLNHPIP